MRRPDSVYILPIKSHTKIGISLSAQSEMNEGTTMNMTFSTENEFDATRT